MGLTYSPKHEQFKRANVSTLYADLLSSPELGVARGKKGDKWDIRAIIEPA
jgi:hypothetical protein